MRGLKLVWWKNHRHEIGRTFTGAWIETDVLEKYRTSLSRTFTGAWIETSDSIDRGGPHSSRTFTGAWIETFDFCRYSVGRSVAPSRVRGLKPRY